MLGLQAGPEPPRPEQEFRGFIDRPIDCVRFRACRACLPHPVPGCPAGGSSNRRLGDSGLNHHLCAECSGPRGGVAAGMGAGRRGGLGSARRWVVAAAIAGALLGDGSAFWIGHREQREILNAWPLSNYPRVVAQSEAFFHRWGALAVFFARFVPPIRAFVPITAGAPAMPPLRLFLLHTPAHPS